MKGIFHDFLEKIREGEKDPRKDGRIDVPFKEGGGVWMDPSEAKKVREYIVKREERS